MAIVRRELGCRILIFGRRSRMRATGPSFEASNWLWTGRAHGKRFGLPDPFRAEPVDSCCELRRRVRSACTCFDFARVGWSVGSDPAARSDRAAPAKEPAETTPRM